MKHHSHHLLLEEVKKKIPKGAEMTRVLTELLAIDKDAVYRRLRGAVPFTLQEAVIIAKKFSISLDELVGIDLEKSKTFRIKLPDFVYPDDNHYHMLYDFIEFFESISLMEATETGVVTNALPQEIFSKSDLITKLNIFRWQYYYDYEKTTSFNDLVVPDHVLNTFKKQFVFAKNFKNTYYVFDKRIFIRLVKEIEYFRTICLIDDQSVEKIKDELLSLIDYLENIAITGEFPETGNNVYLYITDMEVPFSCAYIKANDIEYTLIKTFILTSVTSLDKLVYQKTRDWISSSMRASSLITKTFEKERISFFEKQKKVVCNLCPQTTTGQ